jgi:hypothetical protein
MARGGRRDEHISLTSEHPNLIIPLSPPPSKSLPRFFDVALNDLHHVVKVLDPRLRQVRPF